MTSTLSFETIENYYSLVATQDVSYTFKIKYLHLENTIDGCSLLPNTYSTLLYDWLDFSYDYSTSSEDTEYNMLR